MLFCVLGWWTDEKGQAATFTNLLAEGALSAQHQDIAATLKSSGTAQELAVSNSDELCVLTKNYCDLMYATQSEDEQKAFARRALDCSLRAITLEPTNALPHISAAVCYAKNFPFVDNQTKVKYSRLIKEESEKAIALDPKQDVAFYLLGRWHYGVATMNIFYRGLVKIIYGGLPQASLADAVANFKHAIALAPNRVLHHNELGKVYLATGEKQLARAEFAQCSRLKPGDRDDTEAQQEAALALKKL